MKNPIRRIKDEDTVAQSPDMDCPVTTLAQAIRQKKMRAMRAYQKFSAECDRHIHALEASEAEKLLQAASDFYGGPDFDPERL